MAAYITVLNCVHVRTVLRGRYYVYPLQRLSAIVINRRYYYYYYKAIQLRAGQQG